MFFRRWLTTLWLALADQCNEKLLTLCLTFTVAAVTAPLLLLTGLKEGVVRTLRNRLLQDPYIRELQPSYILQDPLSAGRLAEFAHWPGVSYIAPRRGGARTALTFRQSSLSPVLDTECYPTSAGNPVLKYYGLSDPKQDEVILSQQLARMLGCTTGSTIQCVVSRGGVTSKKEDVSSAFKVVGTMPAEAASGYKAWVSAGFLDDVDRFRRGQPVPKRNWSGEASEPAPRYDGMLLLTDHPDPVHVLEGRRSSLGMVAFSVTSNAGAATLLGLSTRQGGPTWVQGISRTGFPFAGQKLTEAVSALVEEGASAVVFPLLEREFKVRLVPRGGDRRGAMADPRRLCILDEFSEPALSAGPAFECLRWEAEQSLFVADGVSGTEQSQPLAFESKVLLKLGQESAPRTGVGTSERFVVAADAWPSGVDAELLFDGRGSNLRIPVRVWPSSSILPGTLLVDRTLGGLVRRAGQEPLRWNDKASLFEYESGGFRDFHLFADRLEDVEPLAQKLASQGVPVNSHSDEIARVLRLDHYLGELLLIVEVVGGAGGFIVMFTSLFASVVRKQRVFGTLQLLGQRRSSLVLFPVFQSLAVALAGGGQALLLFWGASNFANAHLGNELGDSARYCVFDWAHILPVLCGGLTLSLAAACLAAFRILKIQPSEALRDE